MAVWMMERCLRAPALSDVNRVAMLEALRGARACVKDAETARMVDDALDEYGP
jgi:hypothetical protein